MKSKKCSKCKEVKSTDLFWKRSRNSDGYEFQCVECMNGKPPFKFREKPSSRTCTKCKKTKSTTDFYLRTYNETKRSLSVCKECMLSRHKNTVYKKYKLTEKEYQDLFNDCDGCCKICEKKLTKIYIDHDHKTNKVRGLLCLHCNTALGFFKDNIALMKKAITYVEANHQ